MIARVTALVAGDRSPGLGRGNATDGFAYGGRPGTTVPSYRPHHISSATRASSDMRLWSHGGSNTMLTLAPATPGTADTAFSTQRGISPATGQAGAVRVMSILTKRESSTSIE